MPTKDPRVDAYVAKAASFAKPILRHLRQLVHESCPDVTETIKWQHVSFEYHGILCGMAAFKEHVTFGFWKQKLIVPAQNGREPAWGSFGRLTKVGDVPAKRVFAGYMKKAMALNEAGVTVKRVVKKRAPIPVPPEFARALAKNRKARTVFEEFSRSCQRDYLEWITEAKREETRDKRIATAVTWIAAGKKRNWKYEEC
jgi:uncharacterized protein YdeI (YjbR/CyaY-like superfamily)